MLGLDEIGKIQRAHYRDGRSFREASLGSICPERGCIGSKSGTNAWFALKFCIETNSSGRLSQ